MRSKLEMVVRPSLLSADPSLPPPHMRDLVGIAAAIEHESVRRYTVLAQEMEQRREPATAAAFREMAVIEERHCDAVDRWAQGLNEPVPPEQNFVWLLPPEIAASWEEVRGSSLLTPYRALAIAVTNEERAFAFYTYIAAHAADARVAHEAEVMAREELAHAAELRVRRRQEYHREHPGKFVPAGPAIETVAALRGLQHALESDMAAQHRRIAAALAAAGDAASAALVEAMARRAETLMAAAAEAPRPGPPNAFESPTGESPVLLRSALQPLERAAEIYEDLIAHAGSDALLSAEQAALSSVVERISVLGARITALESGS